MDGGGLSALWEWLDEAIAAVAAPAVFGAGAIALAVVFALSAWPKLRSPGITAMAISDFGISREALPWTGLALGIAELTLAFLLLLASASSSGGLRMAVLGLTALVLWTFSALIARALRSGSDFACRCFGGDSSPISRYTLLRTCLLALAATVLFIAALREFGTADVNDWIAEATIGGAMFSIAALLGSLRSIVEVGR